MKLNRPGSSKSITTQKTLDTELNQSKFSQTFTSYTTFQLQKKDQFQKYLQEKQKDPKFKKLYQTNLPQIPQKQSKPELAKINSKPFQKRNSKIANSKPKVQQAPKQINTNTNTKNNVESSTNSKWTVNQPNVNGKKQNKQQLNPSSSKTFAEKNKQKMNSITKGLVKLQQQKKQTKTNEKKIDLKGFKVNIPGKRLQNKNNQEQKQAQNQFMTTQINQNNNLSTSQKKIQLQKASPSKQKTTKQTKTVPQNHKKQQKTEQEIKRQQQMLQISRFINEVQMKNIDFYPEGYQEFVQKNQSHTPSDLQKININDFLMEPTQRDYQKIQRKIRQNQKRLIEDENMTVSRVSLASQASRSNQTNNLSTQQTSIDLDKMLDGDNEGFQQRQNDSQVYLNSISSKDLRQRNLFLTQVLKGRVTKQDITKLEQMDKSQIKMMKLQDNPKQDDDDVQIIQINMMKKKSNRLFEKNKIQAAGHIYRDCDYLSEQNKLRLERLLNGQMDPSPFQVSQWERFAIRRIDEGIRLYRQFSNSLENEQNQIISQQCLPKDPSLRKQAQRKILKQKIDSINSRLQQIQNIVVNQTKIKSLIQQNRPTQLSQATQGLIDERNRQFGQIVEKTKQATQMIEKAEKQKSEIQKVLKQMEQQYAKYEQSFKQYQKMSIEEIKEKQKVQIRLKKQKLKQIQLSFKQLQKGNEQNMQLYQKQIEDQLLILKQIQNLSHNESRLKLQNYHQNQTVQDLNVLFTKLAKDHPEKYRTQEQKENDQIMH